ncbi:hypothetical protein COCCADRAFT_98359, partial [Bipolaris zeicola 26-R-13]
IIRILSNVPMMRFQTPAACYTLPGKGHPSLISRLQWGVKGYTIDSFGHFVCSQGFTAQPQHEMPYCGSTLAML